MESASPAVPVAVNDFQHAHDDGANGIGPIDAIDAIWPNGPVQLARGRQAKNPNAKTVSYTVTSLDEFEASLREYLSSPPEQPEHTECQLSFWIGASFLVAAPPPPPHHPQAHPQAHPQTHAAQHASAPPGYQPANGLPPQSQYGDPSHTYQSVADPAIALALPYHAAPSNTSTSPAAAKAPPEKISMSILEALAPTMDPKDKMRKQRAIAKCCIDAIQRVDGFRYSFHNCWNSREDDSFRFSYYCNDSLLNKDRAANGKGAKLGKRATKPVYDCKGVLSVKFSASKQTLDVFYKHVPVHKTYEERAPPPRRDSRRRKYLEENDPEALIRLANRPQTSKSSEDRDPGPPAAPKPRKKKAKKDGESKTTPISIESDLRTQSLRSLLELIQVDREPARQPGPQPLSEPSAPQNANGTHDAVEQPTQQSRSQPQPQPQQQPQHQQQHNQARRRIQISCNVCKAKKTKCNGARPACNTCIEKGRQCLYAEPHSENYRQPSSNAPQPAPQTEAIRQAQAASHELTELEKMKKELEEAKARIQQLESEKTTSTPTRLQTPRVPLLRPQPQAQAHPQPQPQPQHQPQRQAQSLPQPPQQQTHNPQQMQTPQYGHFNNHASHTSYSVDRALDFKNTPQASQAQGPHQMQTSSTVLNPTQDASNPYSRDFTWATGPFYGYQTPQQQDQWQAGRYR